MKILIVRNDKLGDFMLSWPAIALLKTHWPGVQITALVPSYTAEAARLCPWIDEILLDESDNVISLAKKLRAQQFDAMLTLFSTGRIAVAGCLARIPYRLAPATKLAQLCYNHRLVQRRSRSEKPEYAYNQDLAYQLLADLKQYPARVSLDHGNDDYLALEIDRPLLHPRSHISRDNFALRHQLKVDAPWVVIHPGSGGSANNLTMPQYAQLALSLHTQLPLQFIISSGPGEEVLGAKLTEAIRNGGGYATQVLPQQGLSSLIETLRCATLFISGSTGPLHIAAAMDIATAAFYPRRRSATPLRWQTTNAPEKRLAFIPPPSADESAVQQIDVVAAAERIVDKLLTKVPAVS